MADKQKRINRYLEEILSKNRPSEQDAGNESRSDIDSYSDHGDPQPGRSAQFYESDPDYSQTPDNYQGGYARQQNNQSSAKFGDQYSEHERSQVKKQEFIKDAVSGVDYNDRFKNFKQTFNAQPDLSEYNDSQYQTYYSRQNEEIEENTQNKGNFKKNNYLEPARKHEFEGSSDKKMRDPRKFDIGNDDDICMSFNHESSQRKPINNLVNNYRYKDQESLSMNNEPERRRYGNYQTSVQPEKPIQSQDYSERGFREAQAQPANTKHGEKNSRQIREGVYQGLMDSLVQLKEHHSSAFVQSKSHFGAQRQAPPPDHRSAEPSLDQILTRFHSLLLSPNTPLNQDELYCVSYLFSFYQNHIGSLQDKITELQAAQELHRRSKVHGLDKSGLSEVAVARDQRQELALNRLQSLADAAEEKAKQAKKNETMAVERLTKISGDKEVIEKELYSVRDKMDKMQYRYQETQMEVDRLKQENKLLNIRCDEILKEKREAIDLAEDVQKKVYRKEEDSAEIEYLKVTNQKLKTSAEGLIEEVCKYKFRVKELELENNALREIKELTMNAGKYQPRVDQYEQSSFKNERHKFEEFDQKFSEKVMMDHLNQGLNQKPLQPLSMRQNPYTDYQEQSIEQESPKNRSPTSQEDPYYTRPPSSTSTASRPPTFKRPPSAAQDHSSPSQHLTSALPPRLPANSSSQIAQIISPDKPDSSDQYRRPLSNTGSRDGRRSSSSSITNMPAQQHLVDNARLIADLEYELSACQRRKTDIDGKLCRMKAVPKTLADRTEKEECEEELEKIVKKMSEVRKRLRDFNK